MKGARRQPVDMLTLEMVTGKRKEIAVTGSIICDEWMFRIPPECLLKEVTLNSPL